MIILGIETSCDETAASICKDRKILSSIVSSQIIHSKFGGVVPEIAAREHERLLNIIVEEALIKSSTKLEYLNAISVTNGPGLAGTLLTGVSFAKGLGMGLNIPVIPINHLEAHIFANFLADPMLEFPFVCLLVSGGHTQLWWIKDMNKYILLGDTRDDAAGEAFDKGARILGLGYPGGPAIERKSKLGNPNSIKFPRGLMMKDSLEFSFSGLKTSLLYYMDSYDKTQGPSIADIAASYQQAIIDTLVEKMIRAIDHTDAKTCVIAGGVAANMILRKDIEERIPDIKILFPDLKYCTDNAAMVSFLGQIKFNDNKNIPIEFGIQPNMKLS